MNNQEIPLSQILSNKKSISVKHYFEIINPQYSTLQILPDSSNRNYDTELIAKAITHLYKLPYQRFNNDNFKITYELPCKVSFVINIAKDTSNFYLICPKYYTRLFLEKCREVWKKSNIKIIEDIPHIQNDINDKYNSIKYQLVYTKEDALSLKINKKSNDPLNNILSVMDIMEDDDVANIIYNFKPCNQSQWKYKYKQTIHKIKKNLPIDKEKLNYLFIIKYIFIIIISIMNIGFDMIGEIFGVDKSKNNLIIETDNITNGNTKVKALSKSTKQKEDSSIIQTQILISAQSINDNRNKNNAISICESFKVISEDNSLKYKKIDAQNKTNINLNDYSLKGVESMKISTAECKNFILLPGKDLLDNHKCINKVDTLENPVPLELQNGYIPLGNVEYRGKQFNSYLPTNYNFANLGLMLLSPQGGGKSTFISNLVKYANINKESCIIIDYIKNCELSSSIAKVINKDNIINIDLSKKENFQSLSFNELFCDSSNEFNRLEVANNKAEQTLAFIDSVNEDGKPLTGKMRRYLSASANIVYMNNNTSIGKVIECLSDHNVRNYYINQILKLSDDSKKYFKNMIHTLQELDEVSETIDKTTKQVISREIIGTRESKIDGILDRVHLIEENIYLKYMFNMDASNNIDFAKAMNDGKVILIRMPENKYQSQMVKNILTTFFTSKIVLATKQRGSMFANPSRCNVFYDEMYQSPMAQSVLKKVMSQLRKFGTKIIISAHYLNQLNNDFKDEIKASGASYMLLQGADKKIFEELKEELNPYELDDLLSMKQFHSLNLIRYEKGYAKFVSKLPKPIS